MPENCGLKKCSKKSRPSATRGRKPVTPDQAAASRPGWRPGRIAMAKPPSAHYTHFFFPKNPLHDPVVE